MTQQRLSPPNVTDYILDLLPPAEKKAAEQLAQQDPLYRQAVEAERQIVSLVKETLQALPVPPASQLQRLMPPVPVKTTRPVAWFDPWKLWLKPVLVLGLLLVLFMGTFNLNGTAPATAVAATATTQPTLTTTLPAAPTAALSPYLAVSLTPMPPATPIAQLAPRPGN